MNKVLIVATHPDDETLGCGGTILKHKKFGDEVYLLIVTDIRDQCGIDSSEVMEVVSDMYNFDKVFKLSLSDARIDEYSMNELVGKISKVFYETTPNIVYLPFYDDIHSDHRKVFNASYCCTKNFRFPFIKKVLMMEVISETEFSLSAFKPNCFVDISDFMKEKIRIANHYGDIKEHPFPRSAKNIKALATFRGAVIGCEYAESFIILKDIWE